MRHFTLSEFTLLIVPYGIETFLSGFVTFTRFTFNRTLWNWNGAEPDIMELADTFNRTLWNWNSVYTHHSTKDRLLLIVPYGIETGLRRWVFICTLLLIVPYGIETISSQIQIRLHVLLIVPYGIETRFSDGWRNRPCTFNRTLWNWNLSWWLLYACSASFNRTLWNWNASSSEQPDGLFSFNRTLWNWNTILPLQVRGI